MRCKRREILTGLKHEQRVKRKGQLSTASDGLSQVSLQGSCAATETNTRLESEVHVMAGDRWLPAIPGHRAAWGPRGRDQTIKPSACDAGAKGLLFSMSAQLHSLANKHLLRASATRTKPQACKWFPAPHHGPQHRKQLQWMTTAVWYWARKNGLALTSGVLTVLWAQFNELSHFNQQITP